MDKRVCITTFIGDDVDDFLRRSAKDGRRSVSQQVALIIKFWYEYCQKYREESSEDVKTHPALPGVERKSSQEG